MKIGRWMALVLSFALLAWAGGSALAQGEPTIDQIYQAANGGRMGEARSMIDQVLKNHPKSAKAHYVKAEIAARQHEGSVAQEELATAERIAPGLPFAKPESVQALRTQIQDLSSARAQPRTSRSSMGAPAAPAPSAPGLPWGKIVIGLAVAIGIMALLRRRTPAPSTYGGAPASYNGGPPAGPQGGPGYGPGYGAPGYGGPGMQPGPGGYGYGQPQPGMGSTLGRGLATGLAVGAGAVAAQEIGRRMFDHHGNPIPPDANAGNFGLSDPSAMDNVDMGGNDFGINSAGSWDDGGGGGMDAGDIGGGGDWDNS